jgi:ATP-dependent DNA helicase RecG
MKSSLSNIHDINWESSLDRLLGNRKPSPTMTKLMEGGVKNISDLIWILPLRIFKTPGAAPFRDAIINQYFRGSGKVLNVQIQPAFGRRGKGNILLYNGYVVVKDDLSPETISLRWFNLYPNQKKQIESLDHIHFLGQLQEYKAQKQIINPQILTDVSDVSPFIIDYPTFNKIPGNSIKKVIELIPPSLWKNIPEMLPSLNYNKNFSLGEAFQIIHGRIPPSAFSNQKKQAAEERLIYEEFLSDQLKIQTRRKYIKKKDAPKLVISQSDKVLLLEKLPFSLTTDQQKVYDEILKDLSSGHPMMRMIQGDVGCGKTVIALLSSQVAVLNNFQVALMCPTEALAHQHYETFKSMWNIQEIELLLGSTKAKEKKVILNGLKSGEIKVIIGTHSLFQESVEFKSLGLAIIDEQHKFGVEQRLKLVSKGEGAHSLIMTATPIPRTLSLAQYGDLDISIIKTLPSGRKGIKTRITERVNYEKYLDFVKSRLRLGEQAYFVFPAIEETEKADLQNVKDGLKKYQAFFKEFKVEILHGQMKAEEKEKVVEDFKLKKIDILISTSVIEVGINIPNSTIMSIYNPERFGLSSLHQLRGRVGRGDRPGFCFLVLDKDVSLEIHQRLEVIEKNTDGFIIAEEDLKFRGEGDLFGVDQSGSVTTKKLANFLLHSHILEKVIKDIEELKTNNPIVLHPIFEKLAKDQKILDTI